MTVREVLTNAELDSIFQSEERVVVDFAAPAWCVPCQRFSPHYEAVSNDMTDVTFVHVDVDKADQDLLESYSVSGVPTVYAFYDGQVTPVEERTAPRLKRELSSFFYGL